MMNEQLRSEIQPERHTRPLVFGTVWIVANSGARSPQVVAGPGCRARDSTDSGTDHSRVQPSKLQVPDNKPCISISTLRT